MDDMNQQPFERQVRDVASRAVGPERHVEALAIARHAQQQSRRNRLAPLFGVMKLAAGALVIALFAGLLLMSGVLNGDTDINAPGVSPAASAGLEVEATRPSADKVIHATGRIEESVLDLGADEMWPLMQQYDSEMESMAGETLVDLPTVSEVSGADPRLRGEAIVVTASQELFDTLTVDDADDPRPTWQLGTLVGRIRISNDEGSWEGVIGPNVRATGEEPIDDVPGNAPVLSGAIPAVLQGSGAYQGLTAYLWFTDADLSADRSSVDLDGADFEALIVNSAPFDALPQEAWDTALAWLEDARQVGADE